MNSCTVKTNESSYLARLFSSRARAEIVRLLYCGGAPSLYVREIQRLSGLSVGAVQQELANLHALELVVRTVDGNRVYFAANRSHPLYAELKSITLKTTGLADTLRMALGADGIECAFVFGSLARGDETVESDVDLMSVGSVSLRELVGRLSGLAERFGREINPHAISRSEFTRRAKANDAFICRVIGEPKLFIVGNEDELAAMV